jgi:hypothetical protein
LIGILWENNNKVTVAYDTDEIVLGLWLSILRDARDSFGICLCLREIWCRNGSVLSPQHLGPRVERRSSKFELGLGVKSDPDDDNRSLLD